MTNPSTENESMVERVARACCGDVLARDVADKQTAPSFDDSDAETQLFWRHIARAAIQAMRKPTPVMIEGGGRAYDHPSAFMGGASRQSKRVVPRIWDAMIDEALK